MDVQFTWFDILIIFLLYIGLPSFSFLAVLTSLITKNILLKIFTTLLILSLIIIAFDDYQNHLLGGFVYTYFYVPTVPIGFISLGLVLVILISKKFLKKPKNNKKNI